MKLVQRNEKDEQVVVECKWDTRNKKYGTPNPENWVPHTPVKICDGKVLYTPATKSKKRKVVGCKLDF